MFVVTRTGKLEMLLEPRDGRDKPPHFGRKLAFFRAMFNNLAVSTSANTQIAPTKRKTKQRKNHRFLPTTAFVGPLKKEMPSSLHNGLGHTHEASEQESPDLFVMCHSSPMTWSVGVSILHW